MRSNIKRVVFDITTDASGDFVETNGIDIFGLLYALFIEDTDFDATVDFTLANVAINGESDRNVFMAADRDWETLLRS